MTVNSIALVINRFCLWCWMLDMYLNTINMINTFLLLLAPHSPLQSLALINTLLQSLRSRATAPQCRNLVTWMSRKMQSFPPTFSPRDRLPFGSDAINCIGNLSLVILAHRYVRFSKHQTPVEQCRKCDEEFCFRIQLNVAPLPW